MAKAALLMTVMTAVTPSAGVSPARLGYQPLAITASLPAIGFSPARALVADVWILGLLATVTLLPEPQIVARTAQRGDCAGPRPVSRAGR